MYIHVYVLVTTRVRVLISWHNRNKSTIQCSSYTTSNNATYNNDVMLHVNGIGLYWVIVKELLP